MLTRLGLMLTVLLASIASPALAQTDVSPAPDSAHWLTVLVAIVLLLAACGISFFSSRRTHQD